MPCHMATWASVWTTNRSRQTAPSTTSKQQLDPSNSSKLQWIIRVPVRHIGHRLGPSSACLGRGEKEKKKKKRASSSAMTSASGRDYPQLRHLAVTSPGAIGRALGLWLAWNIAAVERRLMSASKRPHCSCCKRVASSNPRGRLHQCDEQAGALSDSLLAPHPRFLFPTPKAH